MVIDWSELQARYHGRWVALADDEVTVLASGDSAKSALRRAREKGHAHPILAWLPDEELEIPNDDLLASMKEAEECERCDHIYECRKCGLVSVESVDAMMESLEETEPGEIVSSL
jgi:hypothetical protein